MEFKVKRDFAPIFLINMLLILICACSIFFFANFEIAWLVIVIIVDAFFIILYDSSVIFAKCTIIDNKLIFKAGIFCYKIPLDKVVKVTKAKNYHLSLAMSIERVRILVVGETGKQCVYYISVEDRDKLIALIKPTKEEKTTEKVTEKVENNDSATKQTAEKEVIATQKKAATTKKPNKADTSVTSTSKKTSTKDSSSTTSATAKSSVTKKSTTKKN